MTQAAASGRGRYEIERTLGYGGMATVYLAHDSTLGRPVAFKVLADHLALDESFRARFLREARLAARVVHANVVHVYDAGGDDEGVYIAMEYVDGGSVADELARRGRLPAREVAELGLQLTSALEAVHAAGLVHRDVKPANVLRTRAGAVKLADFGIARSDDSTQLTMHGSVLGTAAYLSPEQARGEQVTAATDLYALGVLLYEALTGRRPYEGSTLAELVLRRERDPVVPPSMLVDGVPASLDRAILECLEVRPESRPPSASALAAQLAAASPPSETSATAILPRRPGRRRLRPVAALAVLAAFGVGAVLAATELDSGGDGRRALPTTTQATTTQARTTQARTTPAKAIPALTPPATTTAVPPPPPPPPPSVVHTAVPHGPKPTPAASPAALTVCTKLDEWRARLEDQKHALDRQKHAAKDKTRRDVIEAHNHALDEQKHELDEQRKNCR